MKAARESRSRQIDDSRTALCRRNVRHRVEGVRDRQRIRDMGALIWRLEVANSLQSGLRRGRIDATFRNAALADLSLMDLSVDPETGDHAWTTSLRLAERYRLTLHDAAYLELAQRRNLPLASLDRELLAAAASFGLESTGS